MLQFDVDILLKQIQLFETYAKQFESIKRDLKSDETKNVEFAINSIPETVKELRGSLTEILMSQRDVKAELPNLLMEQS